MDMSFATPTCRSAPVLPSFNVRQIGNSYKVISKGLEQMMTLLILIVGVVPEKKSTPVLLVKNVFER